MFSYLYDEGFEDIIDLVSFCRSCSYEPSKLINRILEHPVWENGRYTIPTVVTDFAAQLMECFKTLDYQTIIKALQIPGVGEKTAYVVALKLSGFHVKADIEKGISKIAQAKILDDEDLCEKIKANSQPICIENAEGTMEHEEYQLNKPCKNSIKL